MNLVGAVVVESRIPLLPWERDRARPASIDVTWQGQLEPDPGPLALYRRHFPLRTVRWNVSRQLFEIRERNPRTGADERVRFVQEEKEAPGGGQVPAFVPFDYAYVQRAIREWFSLCALGVEGHLDAIDERNRQLSQRITRSIAHGRAQAIGEFRRYLPTLAGEKKIPLLQVGIDLSSRSQ